MCPVFPGMTDTLLDAFRYPLGALPMLGRTSEGHRRALNIIGRTSTDNRPIIGRYSAGYRPMSHATLCQKIVRYPSDPRPGIGGVPADMPPICYRWGRYRPDIGRK